VLQENDWTLNSDHWDSKKPYHTYIPLAPKTPDFPAGHWVSAAWALGREWGTSCSDGWRLTPETYFNILETRKNVETLICAITATYYGSWPTPPPFYLPWLESSFSSEEELTAALGEARRQILDQYGFIAYHLTRDFQWRSRPDLIPVITRLENTDLVKCSYWGAIIDPVHINFQEIYSLLEDGVPIHYQWRPTVDVGPLDPFILRAEDYDSILRARGQAPQQQQKKKKSQSHRSGACPPPSLRLLSPPPSQTLSSPPPSQRLSLNFTIAPQGV
jgi:hypothetical protein